MKNNFSCLHVRKLEGGTRDLEEQKEKKKKKKSFWHEGRRRRGGRRNYYFIFFGETRFVPRVCRDLHFFSISRSFCCVTSDDD